MFINFLMFLTIYYTIQTSERNSAYVVISVLFSNGCYAICGPGVEDQFLKFKLHA